MKRTAYNNKLNHQIWNNPTYLSSPLPVWKRGWSSDTPTVYKIGEIADLGFAAPEQAVQEAATICPALWKLTLKVVSESRVTWATSVPILVFLGLSFLDFGPMYATDRRQTRIIA